MKKTIALTNKYFSTPSKKKAMIINAVHSSAQLEGSKISKKELEDHYSRLPQSSM